MSNEDTDSLMSNEETDSLMSNEETDSLMSNEETDSLMSNEETDSLMSNEETDSLIGIVTDLWVGPHRNGRLNPGRESNFPFFLSITIVSGVQANSYGMGIQTVNWPKGAADHSSLCSAKVNNIYRYTSTFNIPSWRT